MGFWGIAAICVGFIVAGIGLIVLLDFISNTKTWIKFCNNRIARKKAKNPGKYKSDAFVAGYKDLAQWAGIELTTHEKKFDQDLYDLYERSSYHRMYRNRDEFMTYETVENIKVDEFNRPKASYIDLREIANKHLEFDLADALTSRKWLGGDEKDFKDYYAGGALFMSDVSDMDATIAEEKFEKLRKDRLIEARKKGLREVSTSLSKDMKALTDARTQLFSTESVESQWEAMKAEVERSCATDDTVVS